jgi:hypothetical protein
MNLPSDPTVLAYLTGWDFNSSNIRIGIYSSVHSVDTFSNSVKLNFTIANSNVWKKACGFVIAFSKSYFNKGGVAKLDYFPNSIQGVTLFPLQYLADVYD